MKVCVAHLDILLLVWAQNNELLYISFHPSVTFEAAKESVFVGLHGCNKLAPRRHARSIWCYVDKFVDILQRIVFPFVRSIEEFASKVATWHDTLRRYIAEYGLGPNRYFFQLLRTMTWFRERRMSYGHNDRQGWVDGVTYYRHSRFLYVVW